MWSKMSIANFPPYLAFDKSHFDASEAARAAKKLFRALGRSAGVLEAHLNSSLPERRLSEFRQPKFGYAPEARLAPRGLSISHTCDSRIS